jgi:hypothetical protein
MQGELCHTRSAELPKQNKSYAGEKGNVPQKAIPTRLNPQFDVIGIQSAFQIVFKLEELESPNAVCSRTYRTEAPDLASCIFQNPSWYTSGWSSCTFCSPAAIGTPALSVQSAGSPTLIEDLSAGLSQFRPPLSETSLLQPHEIAVLRVVRISKAPWKLSAHWTFIRWK